MALWCLSYLLPHPFHALFVIRCGLPGISFHTVIVTNLEEPSEQTQKRFSLKRLSWKSFKHRYSLQGSSGETVGDKKLKDTYNKSSTLPANETGKTRQKPKGLPNLPPVHNYLTLIADSKTKSGSLTDIEEELSPMPIPDISSPSSYMCVKMKVRNRNEDCFIYAGWQLCMNLLQTPVYSVTLEDGSYVPSNVRLHIYTYRKNLIYPALLKDVCLDHFIGGSIFHWKPLWPHHC